jgi:hypothetical protein
VPAEDVHAERGGTFVQALAETRGESVTKRGKHLPRRRYPSIGLSRSEQELSESFTDNCDGHFFDQNYCPIVKVSDKLRAELLNKQKYQSAFFECLLQDSHLEPDASPAAVEQTTPQDMSGRKRKSP